ncbi:GDCCVxC domain-containing (seleno)protein [Rhodanobacter aciditrophus]|uniref:GDCCVxC domain-containing (seleno)protein n=1 Tax=Rhodanobacter aciditrophus TaxID=1623218 RepID=UPI003CEEAE8A
MRRGREEPWVREFARRRIDKRQPPNSIPAAQEAVAPSSVIGHPVCSFSRAEILPADACIHFHERASCKALLESWPGDCCVVCSYGSVKCPRVRRAGSANGCGG